MDMTALERAQGLLVGLACGDALGTTVEFRPRGDFAPLTDIVGGGPFDLQPGQWTDDTSMALCLGESLRHVEGFDATDQMNRYVNWWHHGYMSSTGRCFDIGNATRAALQRYLSTKDPYAGSTHEMSAGNGSLMRLGPVPIASQHMDRAARLEMAADSARTTHGAIECVHATQMYSEALRRALLGEDKAQIVDIAGDHDGQLSARLEGVARGEWKAKPRAGIKGSGYVVEALEASLWCFWHTDSYQEAVLMAANLGDDADTTAAICGQLAGAHYGVAAIPPTWRAMITMSQAIHALAEDLHELAQRLASPAPQSE